MKNLKGFLRTLKEEPLDELVDFLGTLSDKDIIEIYNTDLKRRGLKENIVHKIEYLNDVFSGMKPLDLLYEASFMNFDEYFFLEDKYCVKTFGCKTYRTFSKVGDWNCPIRIRELAEHILMALDYYYYHKGECHYA